LGVPEGFSPLRGVQRLLKSKKKLWEEGKIDWAMAELMAYGSILLEKKNVRMSGQDVKRGTFSHRHAVFFDAKTYEEYNRLNDLAEEQGEFQIYNSLLSEFGVLGFEYGYCMATPDALVIWEAQFGDFYNGAQVILDQYITAAESKWHRMNGLVMLLPHGYEGQGPEHSSARMERFLQAAAEFNITVANLTTPANLFHVLRRQLARPFRKPLIIMSPKSLLRHPLCVSNLKDFTTGTRFEEVYDDPDVKDAKKVKRVLYCSGKVYYDLLEARQENGRDDVAIVRLEQLYPFPLQQMEKLTSKYSHAKSYWVQEEPSNMGAWQYFWSFYRNQDIELISRKSSASPATGFKKVHAEQQEELVRRAFE
jgi:2-oxoglutarate dehydrogenase E1 component